MNACNRIQVELEKKLLRRIVGEMILKIKLSTTDIDNMFFGANIQCMHFHFVEKKDNWKINPHTHDNVEFGYISNGRVVYHISGNKYEAHEGEVFVIPAGVQHFETNQGEPFEIIFMQVAHHGNDSLLLDELISKVQGPNHLPQQRKVKELFEDIYDEIITQDAGYLSEIDARIKTLYVLLLRNRLALEKNHQSITVHHLSDDKCNRVINELEQYILEHIGDRLNIESLAQKFYYHPKYLSQIVKNNKGQTLKDYIISIRMERARDLLSQTQMTVDQISEILGFSSSQYFHKRFKTEFAMTPISFRSHYLRVSGGNENNLSKI